MIVDIYLLFTLSVCKSVPTLSLLYRTLLPSTLLSSLAVCGLYTSEAIAQTVSRVLRGATSPEAVAITYVSHEFTSEEAFLKFIQKESTQIDCLILEDQSQLQSVLGQLYQEAIFFPVVFLNGGGSEGKPDSPLVYHAATVNLATEHLNQMETAIDQAIAQFIQLSPVRQPIAQIPERPLSAQQLRLSEKLKERLGYLGVYYKRNPQNFFRHMTKAEREELLRHLKTEYREIVLLYFAESGGSLNDRLDNFVNIAFFADVAVAQIVAIHMDLMDEFSTQLKLEGRSDEILQDYRLTLIDAIAHLCEMYRRSIPRES
jgi:circadian clock protein KaiA